MDYNIQPNSVPSYIFGPSFLKVNNVTLVIGNKGRWQRNGWMSGRASMKLTVTKAPNDFMRHFIIGVRRLWPERVFCILSFDFFFPRHTTREWSDSSHLIWHNFVVLKVGMTWPIQRIGSVSNPLLSQESSKPHQRLACNVGPLKNQPQKCQDRKVSQNRKKCPPVAEKPPLLTGCWSNSVKKVSHSLSL